MNTTEITIPLSDTNAGKLIDWLDSGDVIDGDDRLTLILPEGWTVVIEPDGDWDGDRMVDCSTVSVYLHGARIVDIDPWDEELYSEADSYYRRQWGPHG